jgi:hypothetical protein
LPEDVILSQKHGIIIKFIIASIAILLAIIIVLVVAESKSIDILWKVAFSSFVLILPFSFFVQALMTDNTLREQLTNEIRNRLFQTASRNKEIVEAEINKDLYLNENFWDAFRKVSDSINDPDLREDYKNAFGILYEDSKQKEMDKTSYEGEITKSSLDETTKTTKPDSQFITPTKEFDISHWIKILQASKYLEMNIILKLKSFNDIQEKVFTLENEIIVSQINSSYKGSSNDNRILLLQQQSEKLIADFEKLWKEKKFQNMSFDSEGNNDKPSERVFDPYEFIKREYVSDDSQYQEGKDIALDQINRRLKSIRELLELLNKQRNIELEISVTIQSTKDKLILMMTELDDNTLKNNISNVVGKVAHFSEISKNISQVKEFMNRYIEQMRAIQYYAEQKISELKVKDRDQKEKHENFQKRRELIGLTLPDEILNRLVYEKIRKRNLDFNSYFVPLSFFSIIYLAGILITIPFFHSIFDNQANEIYIPLLADSKIPLLAIQWGFLGGIVYTSIYLLYRFLGGDISPKVYIYASFRIIYSIVSAIIVYLLYIVSGLSMDSSETTYVLLICFIMGIAPIQFLLRMGERLYLLYLKIANKDKSGKHVLSETIGGINLLIAERLTEEGVSSIQELAFCDPVDLAAKTKFQELTVRDWKDQALLYLFTNDIKVLRKTGANIEEQLTLYELLIHYAGIRIYSNLKKIWTETVDTSKQTLFNQWGIFSEAEKPTALINLFNSITSYEDKHLKLMKES